MPESSRAAILARLRAAGAVPAPSVRETAFLESRRWPPEERLARLRKAMEAVKTEFFESTPEGWPLAVRRFLAGEGAATVAYAPGTEAGRRLEAASPAGEAPRLVPYDRPVEEWKAELFGEVDAGLTTTRGAIAETGSLILWPSPEEPRLLSLVPPIHVALLEASAIRETFWQVVREERWAEGMPSNALLISGPSKTADIEQTLAYGVHGPKRLVVVLIR